MKIFIKFIFVSMLSIKLFADTNVAQILDEFNIKDTKANRDIIINIQKSIDDKDIRDFRKIISNSPHNAYMIKEELENIDAPHFLLYLAMVESKFLNRATSPKKAGGIWQFMPGTARAYGLDVNEEIDERRDPFLSTDTAFKYLAFLNGKFDKWYLSLMAYNCGDGCMSKIIKNSGDDDFAAILKSSSTPKETKNFIKRIIKYAAISKHTKTQNFINSIEPVIKVEKIKVCGGTTLETVGKSIGLSIDEMKYYNPHIKNGIAPNKKDGYHFYIPEEKLNLYALNYIGKLLRGDKTLRPNYNVHIVAKGETLDNIAKKWDSNISEIVAFNDIKQEDGIKVGDELKIPMAKKDIALTENRDYTIKNSNIITEISKKFDVVLNKNIKAGDAIAIQ